MAEEIKQEVRPEEPTESPKTTPKPSTIKSKWPFLIIAVLLVLLGAFGAYFVMNQRSQSKIAASPSPTANSEQQIELASESPSPTSKSIELTNSFSSAKFNDLSFLGYSLKYPSDWTLKEERDESVPISTVTLTKGTYSLKIFQAATGGTQCVYEGDIPEGPASDYRTSKWTELSSFASLRETESPANGKMAYAYCQKNKEDNSYGQPTSVGHISLTTGVPSPDEEIISEAEAIVKSIKTL